MGSWTYICPNCNKDKGWGKPKGNTLTCLNCGEVLTWEEWKKIERLKEGYKGMAGCPMRSDCPHRQIVIWCGYNFPWSCCDYLSDYKECRYYEEE